MSNKRSKQEVINSDSEGYVVPDVGIVSYEDGNLNGNESDSTTEQDSGDTNSLEAKILTMRPFRYNPQGTSKEILARVSLATGLSYQDIVSVALFSLQGAPQSVFASSLAALNASIAQEMYNALK